MFFPGMVVQRTVCLWCLSAANVAPRFLHHWGANHGAGLKWALTPGSRNPPILMQDPCFLIMAALRPGLDYVCFAENKVKYTHRTSVFALRKMRGLLLEGTCQDLPYQQRSISLCCCCCWQQLGRAFILQELTHTFTVDGDVWLTFYKPSVSKTASFSRLQHSVLIS